MPGVTVRGTLTPNHTAATFFVTPWIRHRLPAFVVALAVLGGYSPCSQAFNVRDKWENPLAPQAPAHGGQVRTAGPFNLELLMADGQLTVYVTDHAGASIPTRGFQAEAVVLSGYVKQRLILHSDGDTALKGHYAEIKLRPETLVILIVEADDKTLHLARFRPGCCAPAATQPLKAGR